MSQNNQENGEKKRWGWKKITCVTIAVILAIILMLALAVFIYWNAMLNKINRVDDVSQNTLSSEEIDAIVNEFNNPDAVDATDPTDPLVSDPNEIIGDSDTMINIMLIGRDTRDPQGKSRGRSDTMILCTINTEDKTITFTSFLRDLYVKLPDFNDKQWGYNRLNANYSLGGREMLDLCLQMNFGIAVDHFVEVDFSGFMTIVDLMGGVDIELTDVEAWYLNLYVGKTQFQAGTNHLNGDQALVYARLREIDGDFQRTNRQRNVLTALMGNIKGMSATDIHELLSAALPLLTTDMTNSEITDYTLKLIPMLADLNVRTLRIPADDTYYFANKGTEEKPMSVIVPDLEANRQILREALGDDLFMDE